MAILTNYDEFAGIHWETGTVRNFLAYRGVTAPHSGKPYSEAMLMGVSGGIVMGYFTFAYEGYDPQCNILTRNTFDPFDTMLSRLGIIQNIKHSASPRRAFDNLVDALESGMPAIVWADMWGLPYNVLNHDEGMWGMLPILIYGIEGDHALAADRAQVGLTIPLEDLAKARGRVKKTKHRLLTLEPPNPDKLPSAVQLGINDCIKLFTEKPPKGSANNFGLRAYRFWAKLLTNAKQRKSWEKEFPAGVKFYAGLTSAYQFALKFGKGLTEDGERGIFADFLDEAAILLNKPALKEAAAQFRLSGQAWGVLGDKLLPANTPFAAIRKRIQERHAQFLTKGNDGMLAMAAADQQEAIDRKKMASAFPLSAADVANLQANIADQLMTIHDLEAEGVKMMEEGLES